MVDLDKFQAYYPFPLDEFQVEAIQALEAGDSVLVAAPTGSGKTVVAEFGIHRALHRHRKAFYTTPLKALSNQKFGDLAAQYGTERVGLLTGDNSINSEAPLVVMTTEVLRNMIYENSPTLDGLDRGVPATGSGRRRIARDGGEAGLPRRSPRHRRADTRAHGER